MKTAFLSLCIWLSCGLLAAAAQPQVVIQAFPQSKKNPVKLIPQPKKDGIARTMNLRWGPEQERTAKITGIAPVTGEYQLRKFAFQPEQATTLSFRIFTAVSQDPKLKMAVKDIRINDKPVPNADYRIIGDNGLPKSFSLGKDCDLVENDSALSFSHKSRIYFKHQVSPDSLCILSFLVRILNQTEK